MKTRAIHVWMVVGLLFIELLNPSTIFVRDHVKDGMNSGHTPKAKHAFVLNFVHGESDQAAISEDVNYDSAIEMPDFLTASAMYALLLVPKSFRQNLYSVFSSRPKSLYNYSQRPKLFRPPVL